MNATKKAATKAGKAVQILTVGERVKQTVGGFAEFVAAGATLDNAKALWDAARKGLRVNLADAQAQYQNGKEWAAYLKGVRTGLVAAKVVATPKAAQTLVNNQLIALGLTGKTDRAGAGGARDGAGRPEVTETGAVEKVSEKATAARLVAVLAYVAQQQANPTDDADTVLGNVAKLCNGAAI
jgi:hypothetical protein